MTHSHSAENPYIAMGGLLTLELEIDVSLKSGNFTWAMKRRNLFLI
jgi:hypothetical protein